MRNWRPTHLCLYVIPEIHGNAKSLEIILNRILPLRKFVGQEDRVFLLGDYIDYGLDSKSVIELLITIQKQYPERIIFLRGNHEELMIRAIYGTSDDYTRWLDNGGIETINSYNNGKYSLPQSRLKDIIPLEHIDFIKNTKYFFEFENYFFIHGSFDHLKLLKDNALDNFLFDNTACKYVKNCIKNNKEISFKDGYVFVGSHNVGSKNPYVYSKYLMLGGSAPNKLFVFELNSMSACMIKKNKSRIYKYNFKYYE